MSQGSLVIPTTGTLSGLQLVNAINDAVDNLATQASGSTDPSTLTGGVKPFSMWLDTSISPNVLRMRNAANTAWASLGTISANNFVPDLTNADIATALGYTPVDKSGDTMTGDLTAPNVFASAKVQAPDIKATSKIIFPDNSEQVTAATSSFPAGTVMLFVQTAAPTGWTKSTAHNDKALRVVSGSVSSGGSVAFSSTFSSQTPTISFSLNAGATTLSTAQMPSHLHFIDTFYAYQGGGSLPSGYMQKIDSLGAGQYSFNTGSTGGGSSHTHSISGSITSSAINLAVQYVDVIICTKN